MQGQNELAPTTRSVGVLRAALMAIGFLVACSTDAALRTPRNTDLRRFVPPGQEEVVTGGLPATITAEALDLDAIPGDTLETVAKRFPGYLWNGVAIPLSADHLRDPDDATGVRVLYFYGIENAKRMAYRNLLSGRKHVEAVTVGKKVFLLRMPAFEDTDFGCMDDSGVGMFGMTGTSESDKRKGKGWFSCAAGMTLPMVVGQLRQ